MNIGREESKSGFLPEELFDAARAARDFSHVSVQGIMAIPPVEQEKHGNLPYFQEVARLYIDISRQLYHNGFKYLSMGMSDDFEDAIAAAPIWCGWVLRFSAPGIIRNKEDKSMRIFDEMKKIFNPYEDEDDYEEGFDDQDVSPFVDDRDSPQRPGQRPDRDRRNTSSFDERRNKGGEHRRHHPAEGGSW